MINVIFFFVIFRLIIRSLQRKKCLGPAHLIGLEGRVLESFKRKGQIRVEGEIWTAITLESVKKNDKVIIEKVDGLVLHIKKIIKGEK